MFDDTNHPYLAAGIEVPYDMRFMSPLLDWAAMIVKLCGGNQKENDGLRLALEETTAFLFNAYPDAEVWELLRLDYQLTADGVIEMVLTNAGPPVHLDRVPRYDPESPLNSDTDGLWYFLARNAVDDLEFKNLGMDGWRVIIKQRLAAPSFEQKLPAEDDSQPGKKIKFSTRMAVPDDASQLMDVTYDTYRYSYPGEEFYHKSKLRKAIEDRSISIILVETDNTIVGCVTLSTSRDMPQCAYMSTLMVRREFRKTRAIMYLVRESTRYIDNNQDDLDLYYSTMVTAHPTSQKAGAKSGFFPMALLLNVGAVVDYRGINTAESSRESFIIYSRLTKPPKVEHLHLPQRHHAVMRPLLDQMGCDAELIAQNADSLPAETSLSVSEDHLEKTATITVNEMGQDWNILLKKKLFRLQAAGIRAIVVHLPTSQPLPEDLDSEMGRLNGIFTGIKPISATEYHGVYSVLTDWIDFDLIQLADPLANTLKSHVRELYNEYINE